MTSESDSAWFLNNEEGTIGPLSEADMRKHVERSTDKALLIRQGTSDWHSVDVIRRKISQLQKNGIFIRYKKIAEGPFTLTRAHDVLKCMPPGGIDVRTGAKGQWIPAHKWLSKIDELLAVESKNMDALSVAVQHVLGRKGFGGPTQTSGELDLADADKDIVAEAPKTETVSERPLWLSPEPTIEAEPLCDAQANTEAQPILKPEESSTPRWQESGSQHLHTEPVIEVVKVMHTAEIADRGGGKAGPRPAPPIRNTSTKKTGSANQFRPRGKVNSEKASATPAETIVRTRPRNHTSRINRTRTKQEKLVLVGLASAIVLVLAIAGWKWLAETGTAVATGDQKSGLQPALDRSTPGSKKTSQNQSPMESDDVLQESATGQTSTKVDVATDKPETHERLSPEISLSSETSQQQALELQNSSPEKDAKTGLPSTTPNRGGSKSAPLILSTGTLFHPRFGTSEGEVNAGTAFAAKLTGKSQILILSALNLFGPAGGLKANIAPDKLSTAWRKLVVEDCKTQNYFGEIQMQPINLSEARPHPQKSDLGDIAACKVKDSTAIEALTLSQRIPSNGERVWLVSKLPGSRKFIHPATVEQLQEGWLRYSFVNLDIDTKSTDGAPIIDQKGKVIAVNAHITQKSGKTFGYGTPVVNFYPTLATLVQ